MRLAKDKELDLIYFYGYFSKTLVDQGRKDHLMKTMKGTRNRLSSFPPLRRAARKALTVYAGLNRSRHDIYWEPNIVPIRELKKKARICIPTIHDLSWHFHPEWHPEERIDFFRKHFWKGIDGVEILITGSEYTRGEITDVLGIPEDRIKVIYHGIDHHIFRKYPEEQLPDFSSKKGLPDKFILFVGTLEPRKNLERLVQAYNSLSDDLKNEFSLVIAGGKGWKDSKLKTILKDTRKHVHLTGYVPGEDLPLLYNLASIFVYPSLYEGFGIPPLEAMGCGCPVLVSNATSMPEVCGNAALYCDPEDIESIREGLKTLLESESLRRELSTRGYEKATQYTWERSAARHAQIMKDLT